jgi:N-acetylneuraminic acid mutarotase
MRCYGIATRHKGDDAMRSMFTRRGRSARLSLLAVVVACSPGDRATAPRTGLEFAISDAGQVGGTPGFFFLPPVVVQPVFSGTFDADIAALNPAVAICDVTTGPDTHCGGSGGTPAVSVFTTMSTPAITVDAPDQQYQVNWDTKGAGFVTGHTYRVHVTAGGTARRELGFADVRLTTTPGQAKQLAPGDIIVRQVGRTLPIHFRIETGIPSSLAVSAATPRVATGGTDLITATVHDLHGALLAGATVAWSLATTPATGVGDATQPLNPTTGQTGTAGTTATTFKAGPTAGRAIVTAASAGLSASASIKVACNCWTTVASMPTARRALAAGVVNGVLYAVGGTVGGVFGLSTVEAYNPGTNAWTTKAPMSTARASLAAGVVNGVLFAAGGYSGGSPFSTVEAYDPGTNTWTTVAPMPTARRDLAVGVVNGVLYAVGGSTSGGCGAMSTVEAYDPGTNTWTTKAPLPTARTGLAVGVVNGVLYAVGGFNCVSVGSVLSTIEAYDPGTNTWTTKAPMPTARFSLGASVVNGVLYAVGGFSSVSLGSALSTVEAYDAGTNTWTTKAPMSMARGAPAVDVVSGVLYVAGGLGVGGGELSTLEAFNR